MQAIDFNQTKRIESRLLAACEVLDNLQERVENIAERLPQAVGERIFQKSLLAQAENLAQERDLCRQMGRTLEMAETAYRQTEDRIADFAEEIRAGSGKQEEIGIFELPFWARSIITGMEGGERWR